MSLVLSKLLIAPTFWLSLLLSNALSQSSGCWFWDNSASLAWLSSNFREMNKMMMFIRRTREDHWQQKADKPWNVFWRLKPKLITGKPKLCGFKSTIYIKSLRWEKNHLSTLQILFWSSRVVAAGGSRPDRPGLFWARSFTFVSVSSINKTFISERNIKMNQSSQNVLLLLQYLIVCKSHIE